MSNDKRELVLSSELNLIPNGLNTGEVETSIEAFNKPLAELLKHIGLPTEGILKPIDERRKVIFALESVLEILPYEKKRKLHTFLNLLFRLRSDNLTRH